MTTPKKFTQAEAIQIGHRCDLLALSGKLADEVAALPPEFIHTFVHNLRVKHKPQFDTLAEAVPVVMDMFK